MKKKDYIEENKISHVDYKNLELLNKFRNQHGRIISKKYSGLLAKNQKKSWKSNKTSKVFGFDFLYWILKKIKI